MKNKFKIPLAKPHFSSLEKRLVGQCMVEGWISSIGKRVDEFASKFAEVCRVKYALPCANGTAALHLALLALDIKKDDEVIVPALTFIATANVVRYVGAKPIFIDCEEKNWNLDLNKIEAKITKRTKAIIPVHLYGYPVDMDQLNQIAKKHRLFVIEDAAESLGSLYKGKPTGGLADIGCFSFFGNKIITTGEGGMLVTNNKNLYERAKLFRDQGKRPRKHPYWHTVIGYNYGITNLQAAVGIGQLAQLKKFVTQKRRIAGFYHKYLKDVKGIVLPKEEKLAKSNYWMYSILVNKKIFGISRNQLIKFFAKNGIESRPFFYPLPLLPPYRTGQKENFGLTLKISNQGINLPTFTELKKKEIEYICQQIKNASIKVKSKIE